MSRYPALAAILRRLGRGPASADDLAEACGLDRRNAERAVEGMREAGWPIELQEVPTGRRPRKEYRMTAAALVRWYRGAE